MMFVTHFCPFMFAGVIAEDLIWPNMGSSLIMREGESVTLSCSYDTSSSSVRLYWYRQYPNRELQYLMTQAGVSHSQSSTELINNDLALSDAALYYCALRVASPVIQSIREAVHKLKFIFHFEHNHYP